MRTVRIPFIDRQVSVICLGTGDYGGGLSQEESFRLLDIFTERGGNFLDTALIYADWLPVEKSASEKTLGRWMKLRRNRDRIVLGTKGAHPNLESMHIPRLSPGEIVSDLEQSLRNLQTEYIDIYWLHRDDPKRPVEEILETLDAAVRDGKLRALGCSNWKADRLIAAQQAASRYGLQPFSADQVQWSAAVIDPNATGDPTLAWMNQDLREYHQQSGLPAIPYSSQANGLFNKMATGSMESLSPLHRRMYGSPENIRRFERIQYLSRELSLSVTQVVLGYLLSQPFPTLPIIGARNMEHLLDSLSAGDVRLSMDEVRYIESGGERL